MTLKQPAQIQTALTSLDQWEQLGIEERARLLNISIASLSDKPKQMAQWQLSNALSHVGENVLLPGPTGEKNELSTQGRGIFLCTSFLGDDIKEHETAIIGQIYAALIAGNTVITGSKFGNSIAEQLAKVLPKGVIQGVSTEVEETIIDSQLIAGVAALTSVEKAIELSQRLAKKDGVICQLVEETHPVDLPTIANPGYILRFITERTVSINTTAIGGNATLLELGSMEE
ncbi:1-pyrroline-5-carboxylate dehydrogenase [Marinomonas sp. 15G1-11]|uniref:1-pyrroline-5-carboxylate dehydrogenase n=1 Tax=Marinomonas phaeophyticola TaxID=3004091 RepID=A0ABT4JWS6_9GAMM|nr:1-pyrroline-5-carboxylate dehydrogenase [Marinomonas sp. 15G1-11]MCZ2722701.1 1-pyrroline-5-carboxylate dehydrogenase [Marinomonas sp. 15G1-11]